VWLGMRTGESRQRNESYKGTISTELIPPHDMGKSFPKYLNKNGVWFRLPVVDWSEKEVLDFIKHEKNPLYSQGSKRVGCFPCLASSDRNKERDFAHDKFGTQQFELVKDLAKHTKNDIFTSKSGAMRNNEKQGDLFNGCAFCAI